MRRLTQSSSLRQPVAHLHPESDDRLVFLLNCHCFAIFDNPQFQQPSGLRVQKNVAIFDDHTSSLFDDPAVMSRRSDKPIAADSGVSVRFDQRRKAGRPGGVTTAEIVATDLAASMKQQR
ncbi:hypothetical protein Q1695_003355 [Nippostrongylus brasiliensis]|nr:hypothetical protein Q1695_003355 [Nippostrongylus brasiliensis]